MDTPRDQQPLSSFALLKTARFGPLFATQFLGAFNDNLYKNALIVLLTFHTAQWTTLSAVTLTNLAAGLFILPFFLFSATAGQLADKYDKATLARLTKLLEIFILLLAGIGFWLESLAWLMLALFLMGLQSALFGPIKYSILPQHLASGELVGGNALVEAGTFVAILIGTLAGGLIAALDHGTVWITALGLAIAILGYLTSRAIPAAAPPEPHLRVSFNAFRETWRVIGFARESRSIFLAILGISWFWLYGALFLAQFPVYAKNILGGDEGSITLLLATFSIGIGVGSLVCEKLSAKRLEIGLVPLGALGMTLFALDFALAPPAAALTQASPLPLSVMLQQGHFQRILLDLLLLGACGGLYCVPLYALVQQRSKPERRARIIAANNIMNSIFMVGSALFAAWFLGEGHAMPTLFILAAAANTLVAIYIFTLAPEYLLRARDYLCGRRGTGNGE
ncbi:MAG: MFS transporter [Zoogloeaceae bacterium]|jgi:MFS family permease|nr:MFS transporter [Zoogloeaceae bacterium]